MENKTINYATLAENNFSTNNETRSRELFPNAFEHGNLYWATALAEEVGEVAGKVKKLVRGFGPREETKLRKEYEKYLFETQEAGMTCLSIQEYWEVKLRRGLAKELADVFTFLDLMASVNSINLPEAVIAKYNEVSEQSNSNHKL